MKPGVYVHIPFCEQRCYYCAFTVAVASQRTYPSYIRRLVREIQLSRFSEIPGTIFFGGGTPSIIDAGLLDEILKALIHRGAEEISLEANPGTLSGEKVQHYRQIGINRISLGAQSFDDRNLHDAGRLHKARDTVADFELLRKHGFANINIDLIAGLPNQTDSVWQQNLDWIEVLRPEHVSIYMLELEDWSSWGKHLSGRIEAAEPARFYEQAASRLEAIGYTHYEISNWALSGFECRHNLKYWNSIPYRGFGVGSHSFDGQRRFWNTSSLQDYARELDSGCVPLGGEEWLTREMRIEEGFMLGLRQIAGFDVRHLAGQLELQYPSEWLARVDRLNQAGWVNFDGSILKLTPAGWLLASAITEELLWPVVSSTSEATR